MEMDIYPKLVIMIDTEHRRIGPNPSIRYTLRHFLIENTQDDTYLLPLAPIDVIEKYEHERVSVPLTDLAGYITYNTNYEPQEVLRRMQEIAHGSLILLPEITNRQ
jgi:hypothetical protein